MRRLGAALLVVALLAGCVRKSGDSPTEGNKLTPQFAPDTSVATTTTTSPGATSTTGLGGTAATSAPAAPSGRPSSQVAPPVIAGATTAAIVDGQGDLTESAESPPAWADLLGGTLIRRADGFELRVRLAGGSVPTTTDEDHTMNVASFYDVDGDGSVDYEVWANLAWRGWGGSWFDNRGKKAQLGAKAGVGIEVVGDEVVLRFPLARVGGAERFRWSLASEWGRYEVLGTPATARDDAPDFDAAARFPG